MHYITKRYQAANKTVFEVCWNLICPYQAVVRARRLSKGVFCPLFDTRSLVLTTWGGCNHKGCHFNVFPLVKCIFTPPPPSPPPFTLPSVGFKFTSLPAAFPQTPQAFIFPDGRWCDFSLAKEGSLMSADFSRLFGISVPRSELDCV